MYGTNCLRWQWKTKVPKISDGSSPHSSYQEEEDKEKPTRKTFLHVSMMDEPLDWFYIDLLTPPEKLDLFFPKVFTSSNSNSNSNVPCNPSQVEIHFGFNCITCGSVAYGFGGGTGLDDATILRGSTDIMVFDPKVEAGTDKKDIVPWVLLPVELEVIRFFPLLAVRGKLIYIMGSATIKEAVLDPWAEVFDTETHTLSSLSQPPDVLRNCPDLVFASVFSDKIIIQTEKSLFSYDCNLDKWEEVRSRYQKCPAIATPNVVYCGYLFSMSNYRLTAYNFEKDLFVPKIPGFERILCLFRELNFMGAVIDLGEDTLCVVWSTYQHPSHMIHFCPFRVIFNEDEDNKPGSPPLRAEILFQKHYPVARFGLAHVFAV